MSTPLESLVRQRLALEALVPTTWSNGPGDRYEAHRHDYDKVLVVGAGSILFRLPELGHELELAAGDRFELPAQTLHAAEVTNDGVTCLEAHLAAGSLAAEPDLRRGWLTKADHDLGAGGGGGTPGGGGGTPGGGGGTPGGRAGGGGTPGG